MDARTELLKMDEAELAEPTVLGISPGGDSWSSTWERGASDNGRVRAVAVATSAPNEAAGGGGGGGGGGRGSAAADVSPDDEAG